MNGDFAAGAFLISFGALIGRITPSQLVVMAFFEMIMYGLNSAVVLYVGLTDIGGSYTIHMFGAYFGLTVSRVMSARVCAAKNSCWIVLSSYCAIAGAKAEWHQEQVPRL